MDLPPCHVDLPVIHRPCLPLRFQGVGIPSPSHFVSCASSPPASLSSFHIPLQLACVLATRSPPRRLEPLQRLTPLHALFLCSRLLVTIAFVFRVGHHGVALVVSVAFFKGHEDTSCSTVRCRGHAAVDGVPGQLCCSANFQFISALQDWRSLTPTPVHGVPEVVNGFCSKQMKWS